MRQNAVSLLLTLFFVADTLQNKVVCLFCVLVGWSPVMIGCFVDSGLRDLPFQAYNGNINSPALCAALCAGSVRTCTIVQCVTQW